MGTRGCFMSTESDRLWLSINQSVTLAETITQWPAIELEMPGVAGVSYQLQGSDDLVLWDDVGTPVLGIGEPIRILQPVRNNHKFYRYLALP